MNSINHNDIRCPDVVMAGEKLKQHEKSISCLFESHKDVVNKIEDVNKSLMKLMGIHIGTLGTFIVGLVVILMQWK